MKSYDNIVNAKEVITQDKQKNTNKVSDLHNLNMFKLLSHFLGDSETSNLFTAFFFNFAAHFRH